MTQKGTEPRVIKNFFKKTIGNLLLNEIMFQALKGGKSLSEDSNFDLTCYQGQEPTQIPKSNEVSLLKELLT